MAVSTLCCAGEARAGGGAHVIDDSEVETPGICHFEFSGAALSGQGRLITIAPACTSPAHPTIELGGYAAYSHSGGNDDGEIGLAPKVTLRPAGRGRIGVAVEAALGFGLRHRRIETAAFVVPLTFTLSPAIQINLNGGTSWTAADDELRGFGGGQLAAQISPSIQLMAETFGWTSLKTGGQAGLRWTFDDGRADLDLLAARNVDGITRNTITVGLTIRR